MEDMNNIPVQPDPSEEPVEVTPEIAEEPAEAQNTPAEAGTPDEAVYTSPQPREVWENWKPGQRPAETQPIQPRPQTAPVYEQPRQQTPPAAPNQTGPYYYGSQPPRQPYPGAGQRFSQPVPTRTASQGAAPRQNPDGGRPQAKIPWGAILAVILIVSILTGGMTGGLVAYSVVKNNMPAQESQQPAPVPTQSVPDEPQPTQETTDNTTPDPSEHAFDVDDITGDHDGEKLSVPEINEKVSPSVVTINTTVTTSYYGRQVEAQGGGSGVIISSDGYIMTNNHVVEDATKISVVLQDGTTYDATLIGRDSQTDLAVVKVDAGNLTPAVLGDSDDLVVGDLAIVIGNPLGNMPGSVSMGIVSGLNRKITIDKKTLEMIQVDAAINPGNSGGALVNIYGEVVGINTAKVASEDVEGVGYAIPINNAKPIIQELINNGYVPGRPFIGISTDEITEQMARYYNIPVGLYITYVTPDSAADKAGLMRGDIITEFDGEKVTTNDQLSEIRNRHKAGDSIQVTIDRNGETLTLTLVLGEQSPVEAG